MNNKTTGSGSNQDGFTIIELLIAATVFSVVLVILIYSFVQISRVYIKGYVSSEVQNTNRAIEDQIVQYVQDSGAANSVYIPPATIPGGVGYPLSAGSVYWFCVSGSQFSYMYNSILAPGNDVFLFQQGVPCSTSAPPVSIFTSPPPGSKELLSNDMQLLAPSNRAGIIQPVVINSHSTPLYTVSINLQYGNTSSYTLSPSGIYNCNSLSAGGAFCSNSTITSTAEQRTAGDSPIN